MDGWSPLNSAACNGHLEVVKLLLRHGAAVDSRSDDGWSPLTAAAGNGHTAVVEALTS